MYNLLLSVGFELCSSYHKKEKPTLELHPFLLFSHCALRFDFNFHLWKYLIFAVVFYIYDTYVSHILRLIFLRYTHTDAEYAFWHRKW